MNQCLVASIVLAAVSFAGANHFTHSGHGGFSHVGHGVFTHHGVTVVPVYSKEGFEHYAPQPYSFQYGVSDPKTGDFKSQHESGHGGIVQGEYSLKEADGTIRTVKYTADPHHGFNAKVIRSGQAFHPGVYAIRHGVGYSYGHH